MFGEKKQETMSFGMRCGLYLHSLFGCDSLFEGYDRFLTDYYRGDYYDRFRRDYAEHSWIQRRIVVVQINDIYLATRCEAIKEKDTMEVYLQTRDPKVLAKMDKMLEVDRRIISHQPEDGFVSYSQDFDAMIENILADPEMRYSFTLDEVRINHF